jgi:hypothetical protein
VSGLTDQIHTKVLSWASRFHHESFPNLCLLNAEPAIGVQAAFALNLKDSHFFEGEATSPFS